MPQLTSIEEAFILGVKGAIAVAEICDDKWMTIAELRKWLGELENGNATTN